MSQLPFQEYRQKYNSLVCFNNLLVFYIFAMLFILKYCLTIHDEWHHFYDDLKKTRSGFLGKGVSTCFRWKSI